MPNVRTLLQVAGLTAATVLPILPAGADDAMTAPGSFGDSLTPQSSWEEILKTPGVHAAFPMLSFGNMYVSLPEVCVDNGALRVADPSLDNHVRIPVEHARGQAPTSGASSGYAAARLDPFSVGPVALPEAPPPQPGSQAASGPVGFPVSVYKTTWGVTTSRVPLFEKVWEVPACRAA